MVNVLRCEHLGLFGLQKHHSSQWKQYFQLLSQNRHLDENLIYDE